MIYSLFVLNYYFLFFILGFLGFDAAYWAEHGNHTDVTDLLPPPKSLTSKELALFQLLAMDQLNLPLKFPSKKKGKGKKKLKK